MAPAQGPPEREPADGLALLGVVRTGSDWQVLRRRQGEDDDGVRIAFGDIEALARPARFRLAEADRGHVLDHHRAIDHAMRRRTILPAPFGVVFRGRRELARFLEDQYEALDEGLALVDGHVELRLHITSPDAEELGAGDPPRVESAEEVYRELRRRARSALTVPPGDHRLLSAAFLVERTAWVDFWERAEELGDARPELDFDLTGPWPPYDFVRMTR